MSEVRWFNADGKFPTASKRRYLLSESGTPALVAFQSTISRGVPSSAALSPSVGFHPENLQVGVISDSAWQTLSEGPYRSPSKAQENTRPLQEVEELLSARHSLLDWAASRAEEIADEVSTPYVSSVNLNVTQICNLKCVYCEAGGDGSYGRPEKKLQMERALPSLSRLVARIPNDGDFTVTFVGGEPMLYPEGIEAVADFVTSETKARGVHAHFRVVTNGTLITEPSLRILKKYRMSMVVSLDGPPELQNRVRPTRGGGASAEALEKGLQALQQERGALGRITLRSVFGPHSTEVKQVYVYMKQWGFDSMELNFDVTCSDPELSHAYTESMLRLAREVYAQEGEKGLRQIRLFDHVFTRLDSQIRVKNFCDSGKSFTTMDASGKLFKCPWEVNQTRLSVGSEVSDESIQKLQDIETSLIEHNNCGSCWARHLCGGGCMYAHGLATGEKSHPDPIYCERTRALISEAIMIYTLCREVPNEETY